MQYMRFDSKESVYYIRLEGASTHKSAKTHAGTVFVTIKLDL